MVGKKSSPIEQVRLGVFCYTRGGMDDQPRKIFLPKKEMSYAREQRAGFLLVGITGSLAILLGIFFLKKHITNPFDQGYVGPEFLTMQDRQAKEIEGQKTTDTDGDGLFDYDELYALRTSPYLKDTDSDGRDDKAEKDAGTDPTCKAGDPCDVGAVPVIAEPSRTELTDSEFDALLAAVDDLSGEDLRTFLVGVGGDEVALARLTDDELKQVYRITLEQLRASGELDALRVSELQQ